MALVPIELPAGVYRNGTDLQSSNRWRDANLVRWVNNTMRPIGGWQQKSDTASAAKVRGMLAWTDNSGDRWVALGTYNKLYVYNVSGVQYDITPTGFTAGQESTTEEFGFGTGFYGYEYYGQPRAEDSTPAQATTWSLDNWGEYLVGCTRDDGKIYEWQLNTGTPAAVVTNAPTNNEAIVVTEERFLFALGAGGNPRKVQWCDRENNTLWAPAATNEAGDIELETSGKIMCGVKTEGETLILTTNDAHVARYQGPPYVYGFQKVGTSCGIVSQKAFANSDLGVIWMGKKSFFYYSGGQVNKLPCDVNDYIFSDINTNEYAKCWGVTNGRYGEAWFFYCSNASNEIDRYVTYNYAEKTWAIGQLDRTSGVDAGSFEQPLWAKASDNHFYEHEVGFNYDSVSPFAESGPLAIGSGDNVTSVTQLIPDERTQGEVTTTFKTRFYPNDTERSYGPYTMTNPTDVRFTGRQFRMRVTGSVLGDWRVGIIRLDMVAGGRR